ncbi:unnamed protein product [Pedinophyceae sp. YPF-701]|nr:unnamed protein product [Pedinophyceae sp. YPF-701]
MWCLQVSLAFLGDSVWELYARTHHFFPPSRVKSYHKRVVADVRAERQARLCEELDRGTWLSDAEREVLAWGRNANVKPPRNLSAKEYKDATAVEVLCAYLYLTDPEGRFPQLMEHAFPPARADA